MKLKLILTLLITVFSGVAASNDYFGANYTLTDLSANGGGSFEPGVLQFKYGTMIEKNIAIEGRLGFGIADDSGVDVDNLFGAYASYQFKPGEKFNPYGILGFTRGKVSSRLGSETDSDLSFGLGLNINNVIDSVTLNIEWMSYYNKDVELSGINLGAIWRL